MPVLQQCFIMCVHWRERRWSKFHKSLECSRFFFFSFLFFLFFFFTCSHCLRIKLDLIRGVDFPRIQTGEVFKKLSQFAVQIHFLNFIMAYCKGDIGKEFANADSDHNHKCLGYERLWMFIIYFFISIICEHTIAVIIRGFIPKFRGITIVICTVWHWKQFTSVVSNVFKCICLLIIQCTCKSQFHSCGNRKATHVL